MTPTRPGQPPRRPSRSDRSRALKLLRGVHTVDELAVAVGRSRNRRVTLIPCRTDPGGVSGVWIPTRRADYIAYDSDASASFRSAIICHELAHMLLDHEAQVAPDEIASLLAPSLDPAIARRFLARHGYHIRIEAEAESFGTFLAAELRRQDERSTTRDDVSERLR